MIHRPERISKLGPAITVTNVTIANCISGLELVRAETTVILYLLIGSGFVVAGVYAKNLQRPPRY